MSTRFRAMLVAAVTTATIAGTFVALPAHAVDTLVSTGKSATASSQESTRSPSLAVDQNTSTRWASALNTTCDCGQNNEWLQVDLGSQHNISRVRLSWEAAYGTGYEIRTSTDGAVWTTVYSTTTGDGAIDDLTGLIATGRYVRFQGTARATQWGYSLWEMEVYGSAVVTPPTTTPPAGGPVNSSGGTWVSVFTDDFSGTALDTTKWRPNWLGGTDTAITKGANSAETACMAPGNVTVSNGAAHLALTAQLTSCNGTTKPHRAAMIQTASDNITFTPAGCNGACYFEARLKLPATTSYVRNWPAFWTNATATWPTGGENDVMEGLGNNSTSGDVDATYHYYDGSTWSTQPSNLSAFRDNGWHTFGTEWNNNTTRWYYDGVLIGTATGTEDWSPHYLILTYTAGTWGGPTATGYAMDVDYVKAWRR